MEDIDEQIRYLNELFPPDSSTDITQKKKLVADLEKLIQLLTSSIDCRNRFSFTYTLHAFQGTLNAHPIPSYIPNKLWNLPEDNLWVVTWVAILLDELVAENIITPEQRGTARKYMENKLITKS